MKQRPDTEGETHLCLLCVHLWLRSTLNLQLSTNPMAYYFTHFSLVIRLPDEAAQTYALELHRQGVQLWQGDDVPADYPAELREHHEDWCFEVEAEVVEDQPGLWLHSNNGGIDAVCAFIQHLIQKFNLPETVAFEWSHDCSKPRVDAYGGGAAIITAQAIQTMSTSQWLQKHSP